MVSTLGVVLLLLLLQPLFPSGRCQELTVQALQKIAEAPTNLWQQEARPSKPLPMAESDRLIRAARDAYADKVFGAPMPIEQLLEKHLSYNNPAPMLPTGRNGIIPLFPQETVVVGTFDYFDEVLTASHRAIYSEMHIGVDRAVYPKNSATLGRIIDIFEPGGSILLQNGNSISYKTGLRPYGLVPHTRYVLFLTHIEPGDFYLLGDSIAIENNVSRPNSPDAVNAVKAGKWPFLHMKEDDLVRSLSKQLQVQHQ
jgi:hypothetical protein